MKSKNILLVGLYPNEACPIFTFNLAKGLKENNMKVDVVLPFDVINLCDWKKLLPKENIFLVHNEKSEINLFAKIQKFTNIVNFYLFGKYKLRNLSKKNYDYVIYTFYHRWNYLINEIVNYKENVLFVHDPIQHSNEKRIRAKRHYKMVKSVDKIIILSKKYLGVMLDNYKIKRQNIIVVPHGLMEYGKIEHIINSKNINFLFFGRINSYKGIPILIHAYERLLSKYSNISLTIAGNGDLENKEEITKLYNIKIINRYIHDEEIPKIFSKKNTVLVLPYIDATQSGVIAIAYYYSIPVIATKTGGLVEQLDSGRIGLLCEPNNVEDLYLKMEQVIIHPEIIDNQKKKMNEYSKTLSWKSVTMKMLKQLDGN